MEDCHSDIHALMTDEKSAKVNNAEDKDISVPSTEEIIEGLRDCFERCNQSGICMKCEFSFNKGKYGIDADECGYGCETNLAKRAIDRLELLQSELLQKTQELERNKETIVRLDNMCRDLNIRADQLEMERDAYMAECDSGRTKGYNEGYSDGYQDGTKGI